MKENRYNDLNEPAERIAYLIAGYINKKLSSAEHDELDDWVNERDDNMKLFEELTDEKNIEDNLKWMEEINTKTAYEKLKAEGKFEKPSKSTTSWLWMAAASVLVIVTGYFLYNSAYKKAGNNIGLTKNGNNNEMQENSNTVLLTLEDGTSIDLSNTKNGLIEAGNATKENDSVLNYSEAAVVQNHLLRTPPGKMFQLKLPDGTNVWLNASSSLKYPTMFTGNERIVRIEGEGYFEVAKNARQPFKVVMDDSSMVTVLGTHFNVNAYEKDNKEVTLVEGIVSVSKAQKNVQLRPGTQITILSAGLGNVNRADIGGVTAWKSGLFVFKDAGIKDIMTQLEQWYGIKAVYKGNISHQFNATFSRNESLGQILKLLELNGNVHFKTQNNIVYVQP